MWKGTVREMKVYLIGMGMGNPGLLTERARQALSESSLVIGAGRLLEGLSCPGADIVEAVRTDDIMAVLEGSQADAVSVVFSGDLGFFSGSSLLYDRLEGFDVETVPGISSLSYFCAKTMTSYSDVHIVSVHGRQANAVGAVQTHAKTFLLTGGALKVQDVCAELVQAGLEDVEVKVGERLSYPDERIVSGTASQLADELFADLAVMLVENPHPIERPTVAPGLSDAAFVRGDAPMTKEEVRQLVISKLRLRPESVLWDIGAGTGSVTIEGAFAAARGKVYAVECDAGALDVLKANKDRFQLPNVHIVEGRAPLVLGGLERPDCVFVGGSRGDLAPIIRAVHTANPQARIVVSAITLETLAQLLACLREYGVDDAEIVQVSVSRAHVAGGYHLMKSENPIYIVSFGGEEMIRS